MQASISWNNPSLLIPANTPSQTSLKATKALFSCRIKAAVRTRQVLGAVHLLEDVDSILFASCPHASLAWRICLFFEMVRTFYLNTGIIREPFTTIGSWQLVIFCATSRFICLRLYHAFDGVLRISSSLWFCWGSQTHVKILHGWQTKNTPCLGLKNDSKYDFFFLSQLLQQST